MNDLDLWHIQPMTPDRWARLGTLLLEKPNVTPADVLKRIDGDKLAEILSLSLDYPIEWVRRFYNAAGAIQVLIELLALDNEKMQKEVNKMRENAKAMVVLREAEYYGR